MDMRRIALVACLLISALSVGVMNAPHAARASSHREAPFISGDQQADATDLYAFVSPDKADTVTLIANYVPFQEPPGGPNFYKFGDDVLYEINIDNNGDALDDISFQFRFRSQVMNGDTFLYNTGPVTSLDDENLNQRQYYSVSMLDGNQGRFDSRRGTQIADNLQVAPANVGPVSFPNYDAVAAQAVYTLNNGVKVFAGPRDDPFFVDLGGIFDLLQGITGEDYVAGKNVHTIALQVPISMLTMDKKAGNETAEPVIGVRTTSYRQSLSVLRPVGVGRLFGDFYTPGGTQAGPWVQVSRLDIPLVNEVVIPLKDKDRWNGSSPYYDTQFLSYVQNPELAGLLNAILGVNVPDNPRGDLVTIFLTGIPGLNQPANVRPSSQLRLNVSIAPSASPSPLGVLGGDTAGFPNGRRLADDITDIELQALAGATPLTPAFNVAPNNTLGDGASANDAPFMAQFPYVASPWSYATAP